MALHTTRTCEYVQASFWGSTCATSLPSLSAELPSPMLPAMPHHSIVKTTETTAVRRPPRTRNRFACLSVLVLNSKTKLLCLLHAMHTWSLCNTRNGGSLGGGSIYIYYMYGILLQLIPQLVVNYPTGDANGCCAQPELLQSLQRVTECSLTAWARRENI